MPIYAHLVRGSVLSIKEQEYIEACHALGVRDPWILARHVPPRTSPAPIIVTTALGIATSIIVEATLPFLGLGIAKRPPEPSPAAPHGEEMTPTKLDREMATLDQLPTRALFGTTERERARCEAVRSIAGLFLTGTNRVDG